MNAKLLISVIPEGIVNSVNLFPFRYKSAPLYKGLERALLKVIFNHAAKLEILTLVRFEHDQNALSAIEVMLLGILTLVKPEQLWNVPALIEVTLSGIVTLVKLVQP